MFVHTACQLINSYSTLFIQTGTIGYNAKSQEYKTVDPDQSLILLWQLAILRVIQTGQLCVDNPYAHVMGKSDPIEWPK